MLRPTVLTVLTPLLCSGYRKDGCFENIDAFSRNNYVIVGSRTLHCQPPQVYQPTPETPPKISEYFKLSYPYNPLFCNVHNFGVLLFLRHAKSQTFLNVYTSLNLKKRLLLNLPQKNQPLPHHQVKELSTWFSFPVNI